MKKTLISIGIIVVLFLGIFLYPLTYYEGSFGCLALGCPGKYERTVLFLINEFPFFLE